MSSFRTPAIVANPRGSLAHSFLTSVEMRLHKPMVACADPVTRHDDDGGLVESNKLLPNML